MLRSPVAGDSRSHSHSHDTVSERRTRRINVGHDGLACIKAIRRVRDGVRNKRALSPTQKGDANGHLKGERSSCLGHAWGAIRLAVLPHASLMASHKRVNGSTPRRMP
jgi:hypothetical protein